jgi:hypothetical protein
VVQPHATDLHLLTAGKIATAVLGGLIIVVALRMSQLRELSLFLWTQRVSILIGIPIIVPLFLGLLVKNTPPWSAWSTVAVGFLSSLFISNHLTPEWATSTFGITQPLDGASREYWRQSIELLGNVGVCATWFVGTKLAWTTSYGVHVFRAVWLLLFAWCAWLRGRELIATAGFFSNALTVLSILALVGIALLPFVFFRRPNDGERDRVTEFFRRLETPVDFAREEGAHNANDARQESVVGWLAFAYGLFIALLALIPNPLPGRIAFVGCGALVASIGVLLLIASRKAGSHPST